MAEHDNAPTSLIVRSHSAFGNHSATFHAKEWNSVPLIPGNLLGSFTNWLSLPVDGEAMADELVDKLKVFYPPNYFIDSVQIVTYDPLDPIAIPRAIKAYGVAGTETDTGWSKATMQNYILRDSAYNMAKIVLLDTVNQNQWNPVTDISGSAEATALVGVFTSDAWAFSSKADLKITTFQKITYKLSDSLRKRYEMD
jgi:hypothetical protein